MHLDQANMVFDAIGVEPNRYRFQLSDIFDLELQEEPFDIVLCLGLLYHVSKPFELMERIAAWNDDLLVIDTRSTPAFKARTFGYQAEPRRPALRGRSRGGPASNERSGGKTRQRVRLSLRDAAAALHQLGRLSVIP